MLKEPQTIKELKALKNTPAKNDFLKKLRSELVLYMIQNPLPENAQNSSLFARKMGYVISVQKIFGTGLVVIVLGTSTVTVAAGSLPGELLYPVKISAENIHSYFTFSPKSRTKLEMSFAGERINEMQKLINEREVDGNRIEIALVGMRNNTNNAKNVIDSEKANGKDITDLVEIFDEAIDNHQDNINNIFHNSNSNISFREESIKTKAANAKKDSDPSSFNDLVRQLSDLNAQRAILEIKAEESEDFLENNDLLGEKDMQREQLLAENKQEAQKAIADAKRISAQITIEVAEHNLQIPQNLFGKSEILMNKADSAFKDNLYDDARRYAKEAKKELKSANALVNELKYSDDRRNESDVDAKTIDASDKNNTSKRIQN